MVSIVMSSYNETEQMLRQSIDSVLAQTYKEIELIIVNDNPSKIELSCILDEYKRSDNRVKIITNERNLGLVKSLNIALASVRGEYVARMDADDISTRNRIEIEINYLQQHDLDIVGGMTEYMDQDGHETGRISNYYRLNAIPKVILYESCIPHPTWLVKNSVYKKLNGYRDIDSCEDYDFLLRALSYGFNIGLVDDVVLRYRINYGGISKTKVFKQFLISSYLSKNHKRINTVSLAELNDYLNKNYSNKNEKKYLRARAAIDKALRNDASVFERLKNLMIACTESKFHTQKLINVYKAKRMRTQI